MSSSSDSTLRRRPTPAPYPHPSSSHRRQRRPKPRSRPRPRPIEVLLHKSFSDPYIKTEEYTSPTTACGPWSSVGSDGGGWLLRPQTCSDLFPSMGTRSRSGSGSSSCGMVCEGYQNDAKVVVTVDVEGSPGPIKTMVRLGLRVDDMIKLVIDKYGEEGRSPRLDRSSASCFDLHLSHFSLECLDRSNAIGESGSRSFYLRKSGGMSVAEQLEATSSSPHAPSTVAIKGCSPESHLPALFLPGYITQRMAKFVRKMRKLCKLLDCFQCG